MTLCSMFDEQEQPEPACFTTRIAGMALHEQLEAFKIQDNSLRLSASRISALAGFHPFAHLPTLFRDLVYQGSIGHLLLLKDAKSLGLRIKSEEEILFDLADKAGTGTKQALKDALRVKAGSKILENTHAAESLKRKVLEEATMSNKLKKEELKQLKEGTRNWIDTSFGTQHEDQALDLYEKICGWEVRDRNLAIVALSFEKSENSEVYSPLDLPTVVAMDKAQHRVNHHELATEPIIIDEAKGKSNERTQIDRPSFFTIYGSVDGIRDELWCPPNQGTAHGGLDEDWQIRKIVVECKHRMHQAYHTPPLYDQIQTMTYCLMYETTEADIIQVVRTRKQKIKNHVKVVPAKGEENMITQYFQSPSKQKNCTESNLCATDSANEVQYSSLPPEDETTKLKSLPDHNNSTGIAPALLKISVEDHSYESSEISKVVTNKSTSPNSVVNISVSRISLDDPIMQHRSNWEKMILPRLRSFVNAVYSVRQNDSKRLLLLSCDSGDLSQSLEAWELLHQECPWLMECDTAYKREFKAQSASIESNDEHTDK